MKNKELDEIISNKTNESLENDNSLDNIEDNDSSMDFNNTNQSESLLIEENDVSQEFLMGDKKEKKSKKASRKERRYQKLREKMIESPDIKFLGPLSYRHLRLIAWLAMALSFFLVIVTTTQEIVQIEIINPFWTTALSIFSSVSTPLFLVAIFATIFSNHKTFKSAIIFYVIAYCAIGFGILIIYFRYLNPIFIKLELDTDIMAQNTGNVLGNKVKVNIFSDLLALTLIHFFINYNPTKYFQGKKIIIFRLMIFLPLIYLFISYIIIGLNTFDKITLPFFIYPFLTTKSPLVHIIFLILSLWIKNRKKIFFKIGGTEKQYKEYLGTRKNSLSFSIFISIIFAIFSFIDFVLLVIAGVYGQLKGWDFDTTLVLFTKLGIGNCACLIFAIPFILLFSYQKKYKNKTPDILIPFIGIGMIAFGVIEGIYQLLMNIL